MGTVTQRERAELYKWADEAMGPERADMLMKCLPPTGWGDLVTKQDLERESALLTARFMAERAKALAGVGKPFGDDVRSQPPSVQGVSKRARSAFTGLRSTDARRTLLILLTVVLSLFASFAVKYRYPPPSAVSLPCAEGRATTEVVYDTRGTAQAVTLRCPAARADQPSDLSQRTPTKPRNDMPRPPGR